MTKHKTPIVDLPRFAKFRAVVDRFVATPRDINDTLDLSDLEGICVLRMTTSQFADRAGTTRNRATEIAAAVLRRLARQYADRDRSR